MAENSAIAWTHHTFNPWWGCQKVSPGCDNCYAERDAARFAPDKVLWGVGSDRRIFHSKHWEEPLRWNAKSEAYQRTMQNFGKPFDRSRVFCASMADVFDNNAPPGERDRLWKLIKKTPALDWLILTKRIGNAKDMLPDDWGDGYPNVWLGATIVNQEEADRDIAKLLQTPARVRFLSMEPILGPVDLTAVANTYSLAEGQPSLNVLGGYAWCVQGADYVDTCSIGAHVDWVIVGGESGPKARDTDITWIKSIVSQCRAAKTPVFCKQLGAKVVWSQPDDGIAEPPFWGRLSFIDKKAGDPEEWAPELRIREFPHV